MNDFDIRQLHNEAMDKAWEGENAKKNGNKRESLALFRDAFEKEYEVVRYYLQNDYPDPARSVLLKSCAALAYAIKNYAQAEELIDKALAGNPPSDIREELQKMQNKIRNKMRNKVPPVQRPVLNGRRLLPPAAITIAEKGANSYAQVRGKV
jgi:tetratricopeptide (TPR) repeat protein